MDTRCITVFSCALPVDLRELSGDFGASYLAEERVFESLMSIFSALYRTVVHVCSEAFLINLRHK